MSNPQHEPTMEEILASIRKIISEDAPENAPAAEAAPAEPAVASEPEGEVLELTQEFQEVPEVQETQEEPAPEKPADEVIFEPIQEAPVSAPASNDGIFSDKTRRAIDDTFSSIETPEPQAPRAPLSAAPAFAPVDGNSIEAVFERAVREAVGPHIDGWLSERREDLLTAMRPIIREWMDEHFPALLEGAVRDEVARVVRARGR